MPERAARLLAFYDGECGFCRRVVAWVHRHDRWSRIELLPIADTVTIRGHRLQREALDREMHVVDGRGRVQRGFAAWRRIARELPVLMPVLPFLWLPGANAVGSRVYRWVADRRMLISRRLRLDNCVDACSPGAERGAGGKTR
jgi:predicted DCC family thiol-disulfide oxidoreductase YuxK